MLTETSTSLGMIIFFLDNAKNAMRYEIRQRDLTCQHASNNSEILRTSRYTRKISTREAACRLGCRITMLDVHRRKILARSLSHSDGYLILKNFAKRSIRERTTSHANEMTSLLRVVILPLMTWNKKRNCSEIVLQSRCNQFLTACSSRPRVFAWGLHDR